MSEPVGWVLHDLRTTDPNLIRIASREEAQRQLQGWDHFRPEQAGRYIVCALVPDEEDA